MDTNPPTGAAPVLSLVVIVRDRWAELGTCIAGLDAQVAPPRFEVVIVDDGSTVQPPAEISARLKEPPYRLVRQEPLGIPSARNLGVRVSRGAVILFTDSDCYPTPHCLNRLARACDQRPESDAFQLSLHGSRTYAVGKMEDLRLRTIYDVSRLSDGRICYACTSGLAIRSSFAKRREALFPPEAARGSDTFLLVDLVDQGQLPWHANEAVIEHRPHLTVAQYLRKSYRAGRGEGPSLVALYQRLHARGDVPRRRLNPMDFLKVASKTGHSPWTALLLILNQVLGRVGRVAGARARR